MGNGPPNYVKHDDDDDDDDDGGECNIYGNSNHNQSVKAPQIISNVFPSVNALILLVFWTSCAVLCCQYVLYLRVNIYIHMCIYIYI